MILTANGGPIMHAAVQHNDTHYMIRALGIPSLTYGPGTTGTAHTPNEYIVIADLTKTTQVLVQVALTLLS
jgi:acetylornithine deacetylase/succinyl-diaminopimelate desuccinylase-like protein